MGVAWIDDLSHELRAPLANLSARLEAMEDGIWPADSSHLKACRDDVNRLVGLVERIEEVARVETLGLAPTSVIRLDQVVSRICGEHQASFLASGIALAWECEPVLVLAEEGGLGTVLSELLANAAQATSPGGRVEIRARSLLVDGHASAEILVSDSGRGICADALPYLFERFFRADPSRSSATGGVGLGLTLCDSLVRQFGGSLSVESRLGEGTEFRIILPLFSPKETTP